MLILTAMSASSGIEIRLTIARRYTEGRCARRATILLIACYELGHQPLAVAWPAAFLERAGYAPAVLDLSVEPFDAEKVTRARFIAISVPMHTALRLGVIAAKRIRTLNPTAHICFYGLYAALNADELLATLAPTACWPESWKTSWSTSSAD